jgi:hypothetical protein
MLRWIVMSGARHNATLSHKQQQTRDLVCNTATSA